VAASPEATSAIVPSTDRSKLAFDLGLFRCGEYLRFEALAEVPTSEDAAKDDPAKSLKNALAFEHRIADTRKVDTTEIMLVDSRKKRHLATLAVLALQAVLAAAAVVSAFWSGSPTLEGNLQFWYTPSGSKGVLVSITPRADGKLRLSGVTEKFDQVVPVEAFFYGRTWKPIIAKKYGETVSAVMMAFIFLVTAFLLFIYVRVLIRESRLRDVLSLSPPKKRANAKT